MDDAIATPQFETGEDGPSLREAVRETPKTPSQAKVVVVNAVQKFTDDSVQATQNMNTSIGASNDDANPIVTEAEEEIQGIIDEAKTLRESTEKKIDALAEAQKDLAKPAPMTDSSVEPETPSIIKHITESKEPKKPQEPVHSAPSAGLVALKKDDSDQGAKGIHHIVPGTPQSEDNEDDQYQTTPSGELTDTKEEEPELLVVSPASQGIPITHDKSTDKNYGGHLG